MECTECNLQKKEKTNGKSLSRKIAITVRAAESNDFAEERQLELTTQKGSEHGTINTHCAQRDVSRDLSAPRITLSSLCRPKRLIIRATGTNIELSVGPQPLWTVTLSRRAINILLFKELLCASNLECSFPFSMLATID